MIPGDGWSAVYENDEGAVVRLPLVCWLEHDNDDEPVAGYVIHPELGVPVFAPKLSAHTAVVGRPGGLGSFRCYLHESERPW